MFDHYAGWIDKITGETFPQYTGASDMQCMIFRDPVGVVAAIIPWNGGNWINPAFFIGVHNGMLIAREEIFGPFLSVIAFDEEDEAIHIANDSDYGLSGGSYTTDLTRAFRVARAMRTGSVGTVMLNLGA